MTESEWLASDDPGAMLSSLLAGVPTPGGYDMGHGLPAMSPGVAPPISARKLRLFVCACCRSVWNLLTDERSRRAVEVAERHADGLATDDELRGAWDAACECGNHESAEHIGGMRCAYTSASRELARQIVNPFLGYMTGIMEPSAQAAILRDIVGNPFVPVTLPPARCRFCGWLSQLYDGCPSCKRGHNHPLQTPTVLSLAQAAYEERGLPCPGNAAGPCCQTRLCAVCPGTGRLGDGTLDPARLAVLSDALEEAGCSDAAILAHLRSPGPHWRGCWAVDLVMGKG